MKSVIDKKTDVFAKQLWRVIDDKKFTRYELLFYLTCHCNLACTGCYMAPHSAACSRKVVDAADVDFYLKEFARRSQFTNAVVFSGGEIFTLPTAYMEQNIRNAFKSVGHEISEDVITDFEKHPGNVFTYNVMGAHVESYFGNFVDMDAKVSPEQMGAISIPNGDTNRVAFHFFPDKTVAFCNDDFRMVGRVPYMTPCGEYKSLRQLKRDMFNALVDRYRHEITR